MTLSQTESASFGRKTGRKSVSTQTTAMSSESIRRFVQVCLAADEVGLRQGRGARLLKRALRRRPPAARCRPRGDADIAVCRQRHARTRPENAKSCEPEGPQDLTETTSHTTVRLSSEGVRAGQRSRSMSTKGIREPTLLYGGTRPGTAALEVRFGVRQKRLRAFSLSFNSSALVDSRVGHVLRMQPQKLQRRIAAVYGDRSQPWSCEVRSDCGRELLGTPAPYPAAGRSPLDAPRPGARSSTVEEATRGRRYGSPRPLP